MTIKAVVSACFAGTISSTLRWLTLPPRAWVWSQSFFWWMPRSSRRWAPTRHEVPATSTWIKLETHVKKTPYAFWSNGWQALHVSNLTLNLIPNNLLIQIQICTASFNGLHRRCRHSLKSSLVKSSSFLLYLCFGVWEVLYVALFSTSRCATWSSSATSRS